MWEHTVDAKKKSENPILQRFWCVQVCVHMVLSTLMAQLLNTNNIFMWAQFTSKQHTLLVSTLQPIILIFSGAEFSMIAPF